MSQSCEAREEETLLGVHHGPQAQWGGYRRRYAFRAYGFFPGPWPLAPSKYSRHPRCSAGGPVLSLLQHWELCGKPCSFQLALT